MTFRTGYRRIRLWFSVFDMMAFRKVSTADKHSVAAFFNRHGCATFRAMAIIDDFERCGVIVMQWLGVVTSRIATTANKRTGFTISYTQFFTAVRTRPVLVLKRMLVRGKQRMVNLGHSNNGFTTNLLD